MVIIIVILLAIAVPSYLWFQARAKAAASQAKARSASPAVAAYYADNATYVSMSTTNRQTSYDAGLSSTLTISWAAATTYCIESTARNGIYKKNCRAAQIVRGAC